MKILMLSRLYHPYVGGVEKHIQYLSKELIRKGHEITVITSKYDKNLRDREKVNGVHVVRFSYPKIKLLGLISIWLWFFRNISYVSTFDLVHAHDVFIWYLPLRFLLWTKPIFTTFHGYESYPVRKLAKIIRKVSEALSWGSICVGEFMKKWYGHNPDLVIYGAVNTKKYKPKKRKIKYDAIFVSRLDEQTGILTYLDVVKKCGLKLLVLGDGRFADNARKIADVKGFVEDPEPYYDLAKHAFVNRYLAILEAFAKKKLVFAVFDNPLKRDYLRMTPYNDWIVSAKNSKELIREIDYYKRNKKRAKQKVNRAYRWVQNNNWMVLSNKYEELWKSKM